MCFKFDLSGPGLIPAGEILLPCQRKKRRKRKRFTRRKYLERKQVGVRKPQTGVIFYLKPL